MQGTPFSPMRRRLRVLSLRRIPETRMLINCAAYQDGKKLGDIAPEDIGKYVSRPECLVWVAMKDPGPGELAAMQHEFDLHELAVEDARHGHQRPKIEEYGDSLFAVLHNIEFVGGEIKIGEVDIFDLDLAAHELDVVQHREQRVSVLLDLGTLVAVTRVLDSELVQIELVLHGGELARPGVLHRDPHEALGAADVLADVLGCDVAELLAVLVCSAVDQHPSLRITANDRARRRRRIG